MCFIRETQWPHDHGKSACTGSSHPGSRVHMNVASRFKVWLQILCCVLGQDPDVLKGISRLNAGGTIEQHPIQGGLVLPLVTPGYRNWVKLRPDRPLPVMAYMQSTSPYLHVPVYVFCSLMILMFLGQRCIGIRFLYPVYGIPEVEITLARQTTQDSIQKGQASLQLVVLAETTCSGSL